MLHYNPTITGGIRMPDRTTKETQRAYFQELVAAGAKYIDQEDLHSGLSHNLFDTPVQGGHPNKRIEGMAQVYFEGHEFLCPKPARRNKRKCGSHQPR